MAAGVASLAPTALSTVPAEGTVVDVNPAHNITVFPNIDFVATFGHTAGDDLTVEVRRNGVLIGTATGRSSPGIAAPEVGLEVNHGPEVRRPPGRLLGGPARRTSVRVTASA